MWNKIHYPGTSYFLLYTITEYLKLEGIDKDYQAQLPAPQVLPKTKSYD